MLDRVRTQLSGSQLAPLQYMSDLHLERINYDLEVPKTAPYLILAGDIGRFCDYDQYLAFVRKQCEHFDRVLLIAGNHEFYGSSREEGLEAAERMCSDPATQAKLVFLNRTRFDMPDTNIIVLGCTLQSHIGPECTRKTNDFRRIEGWTIEQHNAEHELDLQWLQASLAEVASRAPSSRVVIATHYAPAFEKTCHPMNENNAVSQCFSSHTLKAMSDWKGHELVSHWIFGHTHWNTSFRSGKVTVLSNQYCNDSHKLSWLQKHTLYRPFDPKATIQP